MYDGVLTSIFSPITLHTARDQTMYTGIEILIVDLVLVHLTCSNSLGNFGCKQQIWQEYARHDQNHLCGPITGF